jgi:hypothetical protein
MNFLLTLAGSTKLKQFLLNNRKLYLKVAMSDHYQVVNETRTSLTNERINITPYLVNSNENDDSTLHLQLYLEKQTKELEVREIGLFITDTPSNDDNNAFTLLAIYGNEKPILTITSYSELLMDIMFDIQPYSVRSFISEKNLQPKLLMPHAKSNTYGIVRFASVAEIKNRVKGLALATDHLNQLFPEKESFPLWSKLLTKSISFEGRTDKIFNPAIIYFDNNIHQIYVANLANDQASCLINSYSLNKKETENALSTSCATISANITPVKSQKEQYISAYLKLNRQKELEYIFFSFNRLCRFNLTTRETIQTNFKPDGDLAVLFSYKNYIGISTLNKASRAILLVNEEKAFSKVASPTFIKQEDFLLYKRKQALIHSIQDKLYFIGGNDEKNDPFIEIHSFSVEGNKISKTFSFVPEIPIPSDVDVKAEFKTCLYESWIYIFRSGSYYYKSSASDNDKKLFYRYHILSHQWQTCSFPNEMLVEDKGGKLKYSLVVATPNAIYLFLTQSLPNEKNKLELTILKHLP